MTIESVGRMEMKNIWKINGARNEDKHTMSDEVHSDEKEEMKNYQENECAKKNDENRFCLIFCSRWCDSFSVFISFLLQWLEWMSLDFDLLALVCAEIRSFYFIYHIITLKTIGRVNKEERLDYDFKSVNDSEGISVFAADDQIDDDVY